MDAMHLMAGPHDSEVPMEPLHYSVNAPPAGREQNQPPTESFDWQICVAEASAQSIREIDPRAPGCTRRLMKIGIGRYVHARWPKTSCYLQELCTFGR